MINITYILPEKTMTRDEILKWLQEVEADELLYYKTATIFENAPLALTQLRLETLSYTLRRVLNMSLLNFNDFRKK